MRSHLLLYLLEVSVCLTLAALFFKVFLSKLTFFHWNRIFLLSAVFVSVVLPCIGIPYSITPSLPTKNIALPSLPHIPVYTIHLERIQTDNLYYWLESVTVTVYLIGAFLLLLRFGMQLFAVYKLITTHPVIKQKEYFLVKINSFPTCTFFNYILLNTNGLDDTEIKQVIAHEKVHVQQWHSLDLLIMQVLCIIFWFNPLMWWLRQQAEINREYMADAAAHITSNRPAYANLLLKLASNSIHYPVTHNFSNVQLKNRIIMLHHTQTASAKKMRFLLALPLLALMFGLVSCEQTFETVQPVEPELVGTWINIDRTTVNNNDGNLPRLFPERTGGVIPLTEELRLFANGTFSMYEKETRQMITGTWHTGREKISIPENWKNIYGENNTYPGRLLTLSFQTAGSDKQIIQIQFISSDGHQMEAFQTYSNDQTLSGGTIYYGYVKQ